MVKETNVASYQVVSKDQFKNLYWKRFGNFHFAANRPVALVVADEMTKLVTEIPVCFLKQEAGFCAVALLGLKDNSNLFVSPDGAWIGNYVPAVFRVHPFTLQQTPDGNAVLCVDMDSGLVSDTEGQKFFGVDDAPTEEITRIANFLSGIEQQKALTQNLCQQLAELNLLKPWSFSRSPQDKPMLIDNMYQVDQDALRDIDGEALKSLSASGALTLAYGQIFSTNNVTRLIARAEAMTAAQQTRAKEIAFDMSEASGTLSFDNL